MRGRLAPSPTGALHLGNARSFLLAWLSIRSAGGTVILRIEDLDGPRIKAAATRSIPSDLAWLGLDWDEGPDRGGPHGPYLQTRRTARYRAAFERLRERGCVYPCICSRADIAASLSAPHEPGAEGMRYPGTCRERFATLDEARAAAGQRVFAWRFRVPPGEVVFEDGFAGRVRCDVDAVCGDFVVYRGDQAAYQLAVAVDDDAMEIDEVLRGDDLLDSTPRQLLLYRALGLAPPRFIHVPLVVGSDGRRLAKRHGDTRLATLRAAGVSPERIIGWLAASCGWAGAAEELTARDLLERFDLRRIPRRPCVFTEGTWRAWLES